MTDAKTPQKFASCICKRRFDRIKFDFTNENWELKKNIYREILKKIFVADKVEDSYIAGGEYLIKYYSDTRRNDDQINVYMRYSAPLGAQYWDRNRFLTLLKEDHRETELKLDNFNGHFNIEIQINNRPLKVKGFFTTSTIFQTLNSFTYEPCKIGYDYELNKLFVSRWYLCGGKMENTAKLDRVSKAKHLALVKEYKNKNIYSHDVKPIKKEIFYNFI